MDVAAERIAHEFIVRYEAAWTNGAEAVAKLYTTDGVLIGYVTAIGRPKILRLLREIINQGWTRIKIQAVNVRKIGDVILVANEYTASGSGTNSEKTLSATSSHVLAQIDGEWLTALHTAR
jgi:uncharacterized protein (TIGR02246 family)